MRIMHECDKSPDNAFVTLTYADIPDEGVFFDGAGLAPEHVQEFFKRFRFHLSPKLIKHFTVGEYGEENHRPHYHSIIFGWYPSGEDAIRVNGKIVSSGLLERTWDRGFVHVGEVTPESAAYVAGYALKKITGKQAAEHYLNPETGEFRIPEFLRISRGIGGDFFKSLSDDEFVNGVAFQGGVAGTPRYYRRKLKELDPVRHEKITAAIAARPRDFSELHRLTRLVAPGVTVQDAVDRSRQKTTTRRPL